MIYLNGKQLVLFKVDSAWFNGVLVYSGKYPSEFIVKYKVIPDGYVGHFQITGIDMNKLAKSGKEYRVCAYHGADMYSNSDWYSTTDDTGIMGNSYNTVNAQWIDSNGYPESYDIRVTIQLRDNPNATISIPHNRGINYEAVDWTNVNLPAGNYKLIAETDKGYILETTSTVNAGNLRSWKPNFEIRDSNGTIKQTGNLPPSNNRLYLPLKTSFDYGISLTYTNVYYKKI